MRGMFGGVVAGLSLAAAVGCSCSAPPFGEGSLELLAPSDTFAVPEAGVKKELYFPTIVGAKKVMEHQGPGGTSETTETVTQVEEKDGMYTVTVERENMRKELTTAVYRVSARGVFLVSVGDAVNDPPAAVLKRGVKVGYTWASQEKMPTVANGIGGRTSKWTYYTLGPEEVVEVPAGRFRAVRVDAVGDQRVPRFSYWYAAGVGVVKTETQMGDTTWVSTLKSFTPGNSETPGEPKNDK